MTYTLVRYGLLLLSLVALVFTVAFVFKTTDGDTLAMCKPSFSDDFTSSRINTNHWDVTYKSGKTEMQTYVSDAFDLANGVLKIRADARPADGRPYSSGILTTQSTFSQQYGYFEMRAKVPKGQGLWPAFWLLHTGPNPWNELDVFEFLGHNTNKVYLYNHWGDAANQHQALPKSYVGPDFSDQFHVFALDWQPNRLTWYIDGVKRAETTQHVPHEPMFILTNLAVGGSWPGAPDPATQFPAYFQIDYVRVYPTGCQIPATN